MESVLRTVLWQGTFFLGAERCELVQSADGWRISGTALLAVGGEPAAARYDIALSSDWSTREAAISVRFGADTRERRLSLHADGGHWHIEREPEPEATDRDVLAPALGLIDVDIGFTPSTNTLPIRRLAPVIGETVEVTALWVRFPELSIAPLPQRYTRMSEHRYRYESAGGAFVAELEVDDLGLVVTYEGGWQRIAAASYPKMEEVA